MEPTISAGDWLLIDPTTDRWPRRGSIAAFREPESGVLTIKRVAAGPGDRVPFEDGFLELAEDEAWLLADATAELTAAAGYGEPIDSRRYGPVPVELLVGRVWWRYWPWRRIGRLPAGPVGLSEPPWRPPAAPTPPG
jgi:signal peptidase I